jgi:hypothetical protein
MIGAQKPQVVLYRVTTLDAEHNSELPLSHDAPDVASRESYAHPVTVLLRLFPDSIDHLQRHLHDILVRLIGTRPAGEYLRIEPALGYAREIDVTVLVAVPEIERLIPNESHRGIAMRVEDNRRPVKLAKLTRELVAGRHERCDTQDYEDNRKAKHSHHDSSRFKGANGNSSWKNNNFSS